VAVAHRARDATDASLIWEVRRLLILGLLGAALWMAAGHGHVAVSAVHHLSEDVHQIKCDDIAMAEIGSGTATPDASAPCPGGVPAAASPVAGGGANVAPPPSS
jgi:hypothetical protein